MHNTRVVLTGVCYAEMYDIHRAPILYRRFALRIRPKVVKDDNTGYVLTTEAGTMLGCLSGSTSILRNWIHFNHLSSIQVEYLAKKYCCLELIIFYIPMLWYNYVFHLPLPFCLMMPGCSLPLMTLEEFSPLGVNHMRMEPLETTSTRYKIIPRKQHKSITTRQKVIEHIWQTNANIPYYIIRRQTQHYVLHLFQFITIGRQKTTINRKFLEEHGGLQADVADGPKNPELEKEIASAKKISDQRIIEEMKKRRAAWQTQKDEDFVRGRRRFLTNKERDLVHKTFSKHAKYITFDDIRQAVAIDEEFREMFEELVNCEYQGSKVCSSDSGETH